MTKPQKFAFNQIAFKGDTFDYNSVYQNELDKRSSWQKLWGTGKKAAKVMDNNEAYSVQGIINIVDSVKDNCSNSQITETDLLNAIDKVKPNINKKMFEQFIEDTNELLDTYYSNSKKEV